MRTAIISDIHGHLAGLRAVLDDIARSDCRRIVCLGDLVDGGDDDTEGARWVRDHRSRAWPATMTARRGSICPPT
jgi:predicted phosphodiesterase